MGKSKTIRRTGEAEDHYFLVLHTLRLKGHAQPDAVSYLSGLDQAEVEKHLERAVGQGHALKREGRISGYGLTPTGREAHAQGIRDEAERFGVRDSIETAYERFLEINHELLATCTAWQMTSDTALNDHTDASYDAGVIERLRAVHAAVEPVCVMLTEAVDRFDGYVPRFETALDKIAQGETQWFTSPMIESYHTVWFELHEDLLVTLDIERAKEGST